MSGFEERKIDGDPANDFKETAITIGPYGDLVQLSVWTTSHIDLAGEFVGSILRANPDLFSGCRILLRQGLRPVSQ